MFNVILKHLVHGQICTERINRDPLTKEEATRHIQRLLRLSAEEKGFESILDCWMESAYPLPAGEPLEEWLLNTAMDMANAAIKRQAPLPDPRPAPPVFSSVEEIEQAVAGIVQGVLHLTTAAQRCTRCAA